MYLTRKSSVAGVGWKNWRSLFGSLKSVPSRLQRECADPRHPTSGRARLRSRSQQCSGWGEIIIVSYTCLGTLTLVGLGRCHLYASYRRRTYSLLHSEHIGSCQYHGWFWSSERSGWIGSIHFCVLYYWWTVDWSTRTTSAASDVLGRYVFYHHLWLYVWVSCALSEFKLIITINSLCGFSLPILLLQGSALLISWLLGILWP